MKLGSYRTSFVYELTAEVHKILGDISGNTFPQSKEKQSISCRTAEFHNVFLCEWEEGYWMSGCGK